MPTTSASAAGPSNEAERQHQRRWVQLIDAWHSSLPDTTVSATTSRDELVEEISQHAQTLCRSIRDRAWLVSAFQMAIHAVLLSHAAGDALQPDTDELARVEQLGKQLLQLAIHSVAKPYLDDLKEHHRQSSKFALVNEALEQFEQLSRRLSVFERLRGLGEMLSLPTLPLALVLEEPTSTVLLCLASLPQGANLAGPLLHSYPWLVQESAPLRLAILAQVLQAGSGGREDYTSLAASGLLISWKSGREASIWTSSKGVQPLSLDELTHFYVEILARLQDSKLESEAEVLADVLASEWQGQDAQQAVAELQRALTTPASRTSTSDAPSVSSQQRFDLTSVQNLASRISNAAQNDETRKQLAKDLLSSQDTISVASRLAQLVDTNDSAMIRTFALGVVSEAAVPSVELAVLAVSVLYARPAVGGFRLDLNAPHTLLREAGSVLAGLNSKQNGQTRRAATSRLGNALHSTLEHDQRNVVPACQLVALLSTESRNEVETLISDAQVHVAWLRSMLTLVEGQSSKPQNLDFCWLAAYGGDGQSDHPDNTAKEQQLLAFNSLLDSFDASHQPPSSLGGRPDRPASADPALLRFRAAWDAFFHRALELCSPSPSAALALVDQQFAIRLLLSHVLRTGDVDLFRSLSHSPASSAALSQSDLESLVLEVSTSLFDAASVASTRSKDVRLSVDVLAALPASSARAKQQKDFIEAACRLSSFKIKSILHSGVPIEPKEIRETKDKMDLVARLLATQGDAHRSPELILDLARRLSNLDGLSTAEQALVEARTLAMLADAATAAEDFEDAASFCTRLVDKVGAQRNRAPSEAAAKVADLAWKSCLQLSKHPGWEDTPRRISMLAHAMTLCPATQLNSMLRQWQSLDEQLVSELEGGKQFASTREAAAVAAGAGGVGGWSIAGVGARGVGDLISAQTAANVGAGLVGTAANLLPLSFSPLSYFGGSTTAPLSASSAQGARAAAESSANAKVDARTARLFDFDSVSGASTGGSGGGGGGYVDPAERAVRAARAARDWMGWKSDQHTAAGEGSAQQTQRGGGGGGFSLSRGVGWLIGESDHR